ncbi:MAG: glyoxalase [Planctomycetes bacterium]|nr:glyoxalase [Planctomycetota bacterium]
MNSVPAGNEVARPFIPAKNFELSKRFYLRIGCQLLLDGEVAIFGIGQTSFILQNYFNKDWAENFMMQLMVDDVDAWWEHLNALDLPKAFPSTSLRPPAVQPWGLKISYLVDPSGVLWHVAQRRAGIAHDT